MSWGRGKGKSASSEPTSLEKMFTGFRGQGGEKGHQGYMGRDRVKWQEIRTYHTTRMAKVGCIYFSGAQAGKGRRMFSDWGFWLKVYSTGQRERKKKEFNCIFVYGQKTTIL